MRSPSFWSAGYSLHQQAASRFIGTLYGEQYELGLSNNFWWPKNVTPLGEFGGKFSAAVRTTCPEDLAFKFPQSGTPAPVLGSWIKESTFGNQCTPHRRVSHSSVYNWKLYFLSVWGFCFRISQFVCIWVRYYSVGERKELLDFHLICELVHFFGCWYLCALSLVCISVS